MKIEHWKPEYNQKYYFVSNMLEVIENNYVEDCEVDRLRYKNGNCFKTKAEAQTAAKKVKALLLSLHEPTTNCNQLPKLTAEVFNRPDCPEWAKYAAVDSDGDGFFFEEKPRVCEADGEWVVDKYITGLIRIISGDFTPYDWQNSLIERPATLPDWVEIGGYVYDARNGYGKIVSGSVKSCYIEFDGGAGDFVPEAFAELKQARLRPYNADEMKALVGKPITLLDGAVCLCTVYSKRDKSVILDSIHWDAEELLISGYTIDNKPCGKFEHLEDGEWVK